MIGYDYPHLWEWERFEPARLLQVMHGFDAPWWIAGGWALDLWMGRETRTHQDVDVAILRGDQKQLYEALGEWELCYATIDHRLLHLQPGQWLEPPIHGVWVRQAHDAPWLCEFLLNEHDDTNWMFRLDPAVKMPLAEIGSVVAGRVPVLMPEIVLLHKAHEGNAKDEADFRSSVPYLTPSARAWLRLALDQSAPDHPWTTDLRA